jgi:hypothetical protein
MHGAGVAQNLQNMNTQNELNRRMMTEQAFGAAARQAGDQKRAMISGLGSDLIGGAFNLYAMGQQGGAGMDAGASEYMGSKFTPTSSMNLPAFGASANQFEDPYAFSTYNSPRRNSRYSFSRIGSPRQGRDFGGAFSGGTGSPVDLRNK